MLKKERQNAILEMMEQNHIIQVSDITTALNVSDMTARRDLTDLAQEGFVRRIHGGAEKIDLSKSIELSHAQKKALHVKEKNDVASMVASLIEEDDTVYLGPGTTNELVAKYVQHLHHIRMVTNSLHIFNSFLKIDHFETILVGGDYRTTTGAFIGSIANETMDRMNFRKAFIGVNGVMNDKLTTSNGEEGYLQKLALDHARTRYIVNDHYKFNKEDFYRFYSLHDIDYLITDTAVAPQTAKKYTQFVRVISNSQAINKEEVNK